MSEHLSGHTTVSIKERSSFDSTKQFLSKNKQLIGVVVVAVGFGLLNRAMLRRELRNINFSAEFYPDSFIDPEYATYGT